MQKYFLLPAILMLLAAPAFAQDIAPPTVDVSKAPAGVYALDKSHASLVFRISHVGFSMYQGRFNSIDGSLTLDPQKPEASTVDITVDMASVDTNHEKLEGELKGDKFFNTAKFPTATFKSKQITRAAADAGTITGDLTFMGVTKPVTLNVKFYGYGVFPMNKKDVLGFGATTTIKRSEWGMTGYLPMLGDDVQLQIEAEFNRDGVPQATPQPAAK